MNEFLNVVRYREALALIESCWPPLPAEELELEAALGRRLAADLLCPEDMPSFVRSTVDGYAVHAADCFGCSESLPAFLTLAGRVEMGAVPQWELPPGGCAWVPTGGMLPPGADGVVMVENTEELDAQTILIFRPVAPGENLMFVGEDVRQGEVVFPAGHRLRAQDIGMLAALGIAAVSVERRLRAAVISSGDEIVPLNCAPLPGQIRDVNTPALSAALADCGALVRGFPIVPDDRERLRAAVADALADSDVIVLSGGSSAGIADHTREVLLSFPAAELIFHGLAIKPGKPAMMIKIGSRVALGLPGHPVSALTVFHALFAAVISGRRRPSGPATLLRNLPSAAGRDDFVPVRVERREDTLWAEPLLGKSGLMNLLTRADGYIHVPFEQQGLLQGAEVQVFYYDSEAVI